MERSSIRYVVAADFAPSRRSISKVLPNTAELPIIRDISHAAEAVQKATEQNPDWILLDIGLPTFQSYSVGKELQFSA